MFAICIGQGNIIRVLLLSEDVVVDFQVGIGSDCDVVGGAVVVDELGVFCFIFFGLAGDWLVISAGES